MNQELYDLTTSVSEIGGFNVIRNIFIYGDLKFLCLLAGVTSPSPWTTVSESEMSDADFEWMRDPESVRMAAFTTADPNDREGFDRWLSRNRKNPDVIMRSIWVSGQIVGSIYTFTIEGDREVSYWLDRAVWGRGIASRALVAMLELDATRPLMARAASANLGSAAVLLRARRPALRAPHGWMPAR